MTRKILSIGFEFPGGEIEQLELTSDRSLLDADIIVFEPEVPYRHASETYLGKPCLSEEASFRARESLAHWQRELAAAFDAGKLIVVLLAKPEDVYVDTGQKNYSGTGRNARVTRIVEPLVSYKAIPVSATFIAASGTEIIPAGDLRFFATFWKEFSQDSPYELYLEGKVGDVLLRTKSGTRVVGAAIRKGKGAMLLVPPIRYDYDRFVKKAKKPDEYEWTKEAITYGRRLASTLVGLADSLEAESAVTPAPPWTLDSRYRLEAEAVIEVEISNKTKTIAELEEQRRCMTAELEALGTLRRLLYEQGKPLEDAVLEALRLFGFTAGRHKDGHSEFDAVFTSAEGRFLGEVEGKDNRAINIDKFSQLERNIQEDFARDEVTEYAKGVLFGNAHRLKPPAERGEPFTQKCIAAAKRLRVALVHTPDLFPPCQYLKSTDQPGYAQQCREAILRTEGNIVVFPTPLWNTPQETAEEQNTLATRVSNERLRSS
jgi:hypothetical protein